MKQFEFIKSAEIQGKTEILKTYVFNNYSEAMSYLISHIQSELMELSINIVLLEEEEQDIQKIIFSKDKCKFNHTEEYSTVFEIKEHKVIEFGK